jgi:uncharacterized protein YraI
MKRKSIMQLATKLLATGIGAVALLASAGAALADPATATAAVNVRSGPGTSYAVIDTLYPGESVDVRNCQGSWCYVVHSGPDGWVAAGYLSGLNESDGYYYEPPVYEEPAPIYAPPPTIVVRPPYHHHYRHHHHRGQPWPGKPGNPPPPVNVPHIGQHHVSPPQITTPHVQPHFTPRRNLGNGPVNRHLGPPAGGGNACAINPDLCRPHRGK